MRIDRYLHCIRLVKSRTLAQALIDTGHVRLDGRHVAKPSEAVRPGQIVALPLHGRIRIIEILALPARRGPAAEALRHYREIDESAPAT
jgi:ribosome-associated heat shock protein Hsp15